MTTSSNFTDLLDQTCSFEGKISKFKLYLPLTLDLKQEEGSNYLYFAQHQIIFILKALDVSFFLIKMGLLGIKMHIFEIIFFSLKRGISYFGVPPLYQKSIDIYTPPPLKHAFNDNLFKNSMIYAFIPNLNDRFLHFHEFQNTVFCHCF